MSDKPKGQRVKLTITSCVAGYTGTNSRGDSYTIYEVTAVRETGEPITDKKLRSFEELPLGELLDLTVTPFNSEKHGLSFTLARTSKTGTHQRINDLKKEVDELTARLARLEAQVLGQAAPGVPRVEGPPGPPPPMTPGAENIATPPAQQPAPPTAAEQVRQEDLDARFGAAPPF